MSLPALDVNRLPQPVAPETQTTEPDAKQVIRHLAHEMRQPLSALESLAYYLDIILPQSEQKARLQIEKIQQLVSQANWIMDDAVHYLGAAASNPVPVPIDELVTQLIAERGFGRSLRLHLDLSPDSCVALVDRAQGHHLLRNIVAFLRHAADPDAPVLLTTRPKGDFVEIDVRTRAASIPITELDDLFEPFRGHLAAGAGLSLACAKQITAAHQGRIEASLDDGELRLLLPLPAA
jgi:signal transduction histidine kinase